MRARRWTVRLSEPSREDIRGIYRWTRERFGLQQADRYNELVESALDRLLAGPTIAGVRQRADIAAGFYTLHIGRRGHPARHLILFQIGEEAGRSIIRVGRILHDAMDIVQHLPEEEDDGDNGS